MEQVRTIKIIILNTIIQLSILVAGQAHLSSRLPMHVDFNGQITTTIANQTHPFLHSAALLVMFALIAIFLILTSTVIQSRFNATLLNINALISRLCQLTAVFITIMAWLFLATMLSGHVQLWLMLTNYLYTLGLLIVVGQWLYQLMQINHSSK
ncbi:hypothetical protein FC69_GL001664 [Latilactobacillus fuchuensis DSM 14340 = JCM 11249]|uniref:Uncharacterized protein n=2 Tax=Latilactobacillus fuchuensis TaxID=164393 RepID=A0A0R1S0H0_9LACO|nr:hypothetical protein FC69_GL001664 [Latilactobacillus fuchuensis DSM 14340 = JCM 11249]